MRLPRLDRDLASRRRLAGTTREAGKVVGRTALFCFCFRFSLEMEVLFWRVWDLSFSSSFSFLIIPRLS